MIKFQTERLECLQGGGVYTAYIIVLKGRRIFSTEDKDALLLSPETLMAQGDVVVLEYDRNSIELPDGGPQLDIDLCGSLYLHRLAHNVVIEQSADQGRNALGVIPFEIWCKVIHRFANRLS